MIQSHKYQFVILRYMPDVVTREFVNVGVVVFSEEKKYIGAKLRTTYGRLTKLNPNVSGVQLIRKLKEVADSFQRIHLEVASELAFSKRRTIKDVCAEVLPVDDSALQWSKVSVGIAEDMEAELMYLFERIVSYADEKDAKNRRDERDVWKGFESKLIKRNWLKYFNEYTVQSSHDELRFNHAVKNGIWHCVQPLSFDMASEGYIKEKAHKWLGQIASVSASVSEFKVYFLVAEPSDPALNSAFGSAKNILEKAPASAVFNESSQEELLSVLRPVIQPDSSAENQPNHLD